MLCEHTDCYAVSYVITVMANKFVNFALIWLFSNIFGFTCCTKA